MSYNRPPPQAPPGYPPQGHSPYPHQHPHGGPPPPGGPPGGHYPPPQHHHGDPLPPGGPPGGHYPPPQHFHQGPGGPPPPGPYGSHPQGPPPGSAQGYPPHGAYPPPPQQQGQGYGPSPGAPGPGPYGNAPPGPYGAAPLDSARGFGAPPLAGPSFGYVLNQRAQGDFMPQAEALRKAMKGFGTDETTLIRILAHLDPLQVAAVRYTYERQIGRDLYKDVKSETSGYFEQGLLAILDGPLIHDVDLVRDAVKGAGTKEWALNDVLLGRSNADMHAIKAAYHRKFGRDLEKDVADDLSAETKNLFLRVTSGTRHEESSPINPAVIENDVRRIHGSGASHGSFVSDVCAIFAQSSDNELRAINQAFHQQYHVELEQHISHKFSGHMKVALIHMLRTATDPALRDAAALEECMAGPGTKDYKLVTRIVRLHWNKPHVDQVKRAYQHHYKRHLRDRVKGEVSGHYEQLMLALLEG